MKKRVLFCLLALVLCLTLLSAAALAEGTGDTDTGGAGAAASNASVQETTITSVSISAADNKTSFVYGEDVVLTANVTLADGVTATPTYAWVNADGSEQTLGSTQSITLNDLAPNSDDNKYTIRCTVTVDGYSRSEHIEFTVTKATLTDKYTAPTAKTGLTYDGTDQQLIDNAGSFESNVTITDSGFPKSWYGTKNADNSISWNTTASAVIGRDAGTYTVYWYIAGGDNYKDVGSETKPAGSMSVTIAPKPVTATVSDVNGTFTFNGSEITPAVTVKVDSKTLTKDTDYTVSYENNFNAGENTAKAIVSAKTGGNYSFNSVTKTFSITKADAIGSLGPVTDSCKEGGSRSRTVSVDNVGMPTDAGTLSYSVGSHSVKGTATVSSFTVDENGLVSYTITGGAVGTVITLPVKISSTNYADSTVNVVVTVTEKDVPTVSANDITATYTGSEIPASAITGTATFGEYTVEGSWGFTNTAPKNVSDSSDNVSVTFTPTDTANFNAATATITVTINKATPTGSPKYTAISTSGKTLADANLTTVDGTFSVPGSVKWIDTEDNDLADTTEVTVNTAYKWLFTPSDTANYNTLTGKITLYPYTAPSYIPSTKPAAPQPEPTFADVPADAYYAETVRWAVENGITTGVGGGSFAPDASCTRAQIVTFLWREAGCPEPKAASSLTDVSADAYYAKAVAWAVENGIADGIGNNQFAPNQTCTRAQAVAFLFRYEAANGMGAVTLQELVFGFGDAASVPGYALSAFNWALASGIVKGANDALLPNDTCTRAQIVTMLYRGANR